MSLITYLNDRPIEIQTSRERPKSAPYLRLKKAKGLQSVKVFSFTVPEKPKSWTELARPFEFLTSIKLQNIKKLKGDPLKTLRTFRKKSHNAKKTERGSFVTFYHPK